MSLNYGYNWLKCIYFFIINYYKKFYRNKNIGKIAAFEKCLNECFLLIKNEDCENNAVSPLLENYFNSNKITLSNDNSLCLSAILNKFQSSFINKRDLIDLEYLKLDFAKYFHEILLINLDYITYFYYKRDFNSAFGRIIHCFHYFIIIIEEKLQMTTEKFHNLVDDFFANMIETCTGYIKYNHTINGNSQAIFYGKSLQIIIEDFLNWKKKLNNDLLFRNTYFLKSIIDFYIEVSLASLDSSYLLQSIKFCYFLIFMHSNISQEKFEEELENEELKIEKTKVFDNLAKIKIDLANKVICITLQSLAYSYVLNFLFTENQR